MRPLPHLGASDCTKLIQATIPSCNAVLGKHFHRGVLLHVFLSPEFPTLNGNCLGTPNPYNVSEKHWRYTSNLHRSTPPICNAVSRWLLSFGERETPRSTSNLYGNTPPICTAVRLPSVPAILLRKYQGLGVPESSSFKQGLCCSLTSSLSRTLLPEIRNLSCTRLRVPPVALHVSRYTCRS